jgi:hypothetical protein
MYTIHGNRNALIWKVTPFTEMNLVMLLSSMCAISGQGLTPLLSVQRNKAQVPVPAVPLGLEIAKMRQVCDPVDASHRIIW